MLQGQPLPINAALIETNATQWSTSLAITNTLNVETSTVESIFLDYESYRFNLSYQYGLNENWNIKFDLPIIFQGGGVFDSIIDNWHDFFGLPEANRPFVERNQYKLNYTSQGQTLIERDEENISLGDLQLSAGYQLIDNDKTAISLWSSLKLPTGNKNKLTGNGAADLSAWFAINQSLSESWLLNLNAGVTLPGPNDFQNIPLSDYAVYGHAMLGWLVTDTINLKVQLQGHTSYFDNSHLKILGSTYLITFGGTIRINNCDYFDIAMSEDIKTGGSPDAALLFGWRRNLSSC